ncbi:MAG: hypothetical protein RSB82_02210 [Victivallaceae bacterium]
MTDDISTPESLKKKLTSLMESMDNDNFCFEEFFEIYEQFVDNLKLVLKNERKECRELKIIAKDDVGNVLTSANGDLVVNDFNLGRIID